MCAIAAATPGRPLLGLRAILPMFIAMVSLAFMVTYLFGPRPLLAIVSAGTSVDRQVVWGVVIGHEVAIPAWVAIRNIRVFAGFRDQMRALALRMDLGGFNPLWFGLCAGAGEEADCNK